MSDPIHGSLGPPKVRAVEANEDQKLEEELRSLTPRSWEHEQETVFDTANSIAKAEKLVGGKMA